jgi:RNA polymerase sigma-54 factor
MDSMMPMDLRPQSVQKMMLSPKMLISMRVLQLSILDLRTYLRFELEENPFLEEEIVAESSDEELEEFDEELTRLSEKIRDEEEYYNAPMEQTDVTVQQKRRYLESLVVKKESLYEHLLWQLNVLAKDEKQRRIGQFLIGNLNADGYLKISLRDAQNALGESMKSIKSALTLIRSFDPSGVGARNLKEALLIQLISGGKADSHLYKIVYSHLADLAGRNYKKIAKSLRISLNEVKQAKQAIAHLEPKPGRAFSLDRSMKITPDVFLDKNNSTYNIVINEEGLPRLKINWRYAKMLKNKKQDKKTIDFFRERLLKAEWLLDAVRRRQLTIERICAYLIETQRDFLEIGERGLKPLALRDVAEKLSISEATVSRVVSNKYLQAPWRIYRLKQFFAGAIMQEGNRFISNTYIKKKIESIIDKEDYRSPLSDAKIALFLRQEGINIARRTVAKYREQLRILPSHLRRETTRFH